MNGIEALDLVRHWAQDDQIGHYIELQRAVRQYCQHTGYDWLRESDTGVLKFQTGVTAYNLGQLGYRRIVRLWVQNSTTGNWDQMQEETQITFESRMVEFTDSSGNVTQSVPLFYKIEGIGDQSGIKITVGPPPNSTFSGRIDGLSESPIIAYNQSLPGPVEYHEVIVRLAVGFHKQHMGAAKLQSAQGQEQMMVAQALISDGEKWEGRARKEFEKVVHDNLPSRTIKPTWARAPIAR